MLEACLILVMIYLIYKIIKNKKGIAGGMGGGAIIDGLWLHQELIEKNLKKEIEKMLFTKI